MTRKQKFPAPPFRLLALLACLVFLLSPALPLRAQSPFQRPGLPGRGGDSMGNPMGDQQSIARSQLQTGIGLTRQGRFRQAIPHFLSAQGYLSGQEAYANDFNLALCYVAIGKYKSAIGVLRGIHAGGQAAANVDNLLAQAYVGAGHPRKAFSALKRAASVQPRNEKLFLFVADACTGSRAYQLGMKVVDLGLHSLPHSAPLHYQRGVFLSLLERGDLAVGEFQLAARYDPGGLIGDMATAQRALIQGNMPSAIAAARSGLRKSRDNYVLLAILGKALVRTGASPGQPEFTEALDAVKKAVDERPGDVDSQITLGKLYLMAGRLDQAISHLEAARKIDPRKTAIYSHLAVAYRRKGNMGKARQMLEALTRLNRQSVESYRSGSSKNKKGHAAAGMAQPPPDIPHLD